MSNFEFLNSSIYEHLPYLTAFPLHPWPRSVTPFEANLSSIANKVRSTRSFHFTSNHQTLPIYYRIHELGHSCVFSSSVINVKFTNAATWFSSEALNDPDLKKISDSGKIGRRKGNAKREILSWLGGTLSAENTTSQALGIKGNLGIYTWKICLWIFP